MASMSSPRVWPRAKDQLEGFWMIIWDIHWYQSIYPSTVSHWYLTRTLLSSRVSTWNCHLPQKTIALCVGHLVFICNIPSFNLFRTKWRGRNNLNSIKLFKYHFWMVGLDDIYALKTSTEIANGTQWMTISGILIWVPYNLEMKIGIINITSLTKICIMYENKLPHPHASN